MDTLEADRDQGAMTSSTFSPRFLTCLVFNWHDWHHWAPSRCFPVQRPLWILLGAVDFVDSNLNVKVYHSRAMLITNLLHSPTFAELRPRPVWLGLLVRYPSLIRTSRFRSWTGTSWRTGRRATSLAFCPTVPLQHSHNLCSPESIMARTTPPSCPPSAPSPPAYSEV
jgi:hypothetical protein